MPSRSRVWLRRAQPLVHLAALVPLAVLLRDGLANNLTVNPIQAITQRTGLTALALLIASLACTPASSLLKLHAALGWRRPLGLYAFMYATLHFLTFVGLDYLFEWRLIRGAIFEKRYALVGLAAFSLLIPLALTSTGGWMRRLGRRWKSLHRLVYPAALLVIVHYTWVVKSDIRPPMLWGSALLLLLLARLPAVRRVVAGRRTARPGAAARAKTGPQAQDPRP